MLLRVRARLETTVDDSWDRSERLSEPPTSAWCRCGRRCTCPRGARDAVERRWVPKWRCLLVRSVMPVGMVELVPAGGGVVRASPALVRNVEEPRSAVLRRTRSAVTQGHKVRRRKCLLSCAGLVGDDQGTCTEVGNGQRRLGLVRKLLKVHALDPSCRCDSWRGGI